MNKSHILASYIWLLGITSFAFRQVTWMHLNRVMLLTIDKTTITLIPRFRVTRDDSSTWTLHIQDVRLEDTGYYVCQVNMEPVINQVGYLQVVGKYIMAIGVCVWWVPYSRACELRKSGKTWKSMMSYSRWGQQNMGCNMPFVNWMWYLKLPLCITSLSN